MNDIAPAVLNRSCGTCTLCCKLVPVKELRKPANTRCDHQCFKGCRIYEKRPMSCRMWSCRWLCDDDTRDLTRPDRAHYVIDLMADFVTVVDEDTGERTPIPIIQLWIDPDYPDAHRDPALRAYLDTIEGYATLVRYANERGLMLIPPRMSGKGWVEIESHYKPEGEHTQAEIAKVLDSLS